MGRLLYQLSPSEKQNVLHLCTCSRGKGRSILNEFNVRLTNVINKPFSYGYWALILPQISFSILYSSQCSLLAQRVPVILYETVSVLWADILDIYIFFLNEKFPSHLFWVKEIRSEYFEYLETYLDIYYIYYIIYFCMFTQKEQVSIKFGWCVLPYCKSRFKIKTMFLVYI